MSTALAERQRGSDPSPRLLAALAARVVPLLVSLAVLGWLLWPYRAAAGRAMLAAAIERASGWTLAVAVLMAVGSWLTDAYAVAGTFRRLGCAVTFRELLLVRGATLVFDAVNPSLGQAALVLVMHRRGVPLGLTLAAGALLNLVFLVQITLIAAAGLLVGAPAGGMTGTTVALALGLVAVYLIVLAWRPRRLARLPMLRSLFAAGLGGHALAFLYRLPNMAVLIGCQLLFIRCFGIAIPVGVALVYLPAVMFIMGIPISVQGLGPTQLAQVAFFTRYAAGDPATAVAAVLAWGIGSLALTNLGSLLVGLGCLATSTGRQGLRAARGSAIIVPSPPPGG
jgi:hypothetical protein